MHQFSSKQIRKQNYLALVILGVFCAIGLCIHSYFNYSLTPVDKDPQRSVRIIIPRNSTDQQVSKILKQQDLVRSQYVFYYYLQTHKTNGVKAGTFELKKSQSVPEITTQLQENRHAKKY
ncbi:endolytic transglycosylase MltG [uncultured Limosilactobacillus sp.]|uniref:endolytic transglycosylase MltG n=1 Tax=uncultured Limosilactobacillus sp. TaxID=2837629 RepID=UPI0025DBC97B|nr:endolytic transglycosylase MltG [uncultured Limosilactobacillus sp.]